MGNAVKLNEDVGPVSETNLYVFEISNLYRSQFSGNQYAGCGQGVKKCFNSAARGNGFTTFTGLQVGSITTTAGAVTPDKPAKVRDEFWVSYGHMPYIWRRHNGPWEHCTFCI